MNKALPRIAKILSLVLFALSAVLLMALELKFAGWVVLATGVALTLMSHGLFRRDMLLLYGSLTLLGLIPITTDTSNQNFLLMGFVLSTALLLPYVVSRFAFKDREAVQFRWHHGRRWLRSEVAYILVTAAVAYLLLPIYFSTTNAHLNWSVTPTTEGIIRLFIGTNALGIWDELFFVSTVLGLLRRHLSFWQANALQAIVFTSFLYELGFTGWGPLAIYPFALLQGYIFRRTDSLLYVITIHLTLDLVLFLALINAHHPQLVNIFIS